MQMAETGKSIDNLNLQNRINELNNIYVLYQFFGDNAFRAIASYYENSGYSKGIERITKLIRENKFSISDFAENPQKSIADFLQGYFIDRGGNLPQVWYEENTVFLKTEYCKYCVTIEAEKTAQNCHDDVCAIYCRAFAKGLISIFETLFPSIVINFYNVSTRRDGSGNDCVEAFQIISAKNKYYRYYHNYKNEVMVK